MSISLKNVNSFPGERQAQAEEQEQLREVHGLREGQHLRGRRLHRWLLSRNCFVVKKIPPEPKLSQGEALMKVTFATKLSFVA